jgi:branched-chain amino acid transport system permease protein
MSLLIYGTVTSIILALYAVGFSLTYGISGLANFTHGALYILSGFIAWHLMHYLDLPFLVAIPLTVLAAALIGFVMYWALLLRVRGIAVSELIVTFAAGVAILELLTWGRFYGTRYSLPILFEEGIEIRGVVVDGQRLLV